MSKYDAETTLASYLEAEWGDRLFEDPPSPQDELDAGPRRKAYFYDQVATMLADAAEAYDAHRHPFLDVGAATGRLGFEWLSRYPEHTEVLLVEPSQTLLAHARLILQGPEQLTWVPVVGTKRYPKFASVKTPRPLRACGNLHFHNGMGETIPRPKKYFGVLACLNVVDRHESPRAFLRRVLEFLRPGGVAALSSPFDWDARYTPEGEWFDDLRQVLDPTWDILQLLNVPYRFRYTERQRVEFSSQVVIVRKPLEIV